VVCWKGRVGRHDGTGKGAQTAPQVTFKEKPWLLQDTESGKGIDGNLRKRKKPGTVTTMYSGGTNSQLLTNPSTRKRKENRQTPQAEKERREKEEKGGLLSRSRI